MIAKDARKIILVGRWYVIEPLGILYLAGLAKRLDWDVDVILVREGDFTELYERVRTWKPDIVAFSIWTGYHMQAFRACDEVAEMGAKVIIGGPHATYFTSECLKHSTWTVKGEGFRNFRRILEGELAPGVHFDTERVAEGFPVPNRELVYTRYPHLGNSPIKSMFCSVGCPFHCTYCYAPTYNVMYGGFKLTVRPVDELITEAIELRDHWPVSMIYMQDDIFGFDIPWLAEFAQKWHEQVGVAWHCQIRLELTRDERRLDLFKKGGCTGITLAIESGNDFLRRHVLLRPMPDELIVAGIRKIQDRGMTLRTEQILSVPFSSLETDLQTLELNCRLKPEMAWTSILAPYGGTVMGSISSAFGLYRGVNDDLSETFFSKSVLRHLDGGLTSIEPIVSKLMKGANDNPLQRMYARDTDKLRANVYLKREAGSETDEHIGQVTYLSLEENKQYADQIVTLQRLFYWFAKVSKGHELGRAFVTLPPEERTWARLGDMTKTHLVHAGHGPSLENWMEKLATEMGLASFDYLPTPIRENPWYFVYLPGGGAFGRKLIADKAFDGTSREAFDKVGDATRRWLFMTSLYKIEPALSPIAQI